MQNRCPASVPVFHQYTPWRLVPGRAQEHAWPKGCEMSLKAVGTSTCLNDLMERILVIGIDNTTVKTQHLVLQVMSFNFTNSSWQMDLYHKSCCDCFWNAFPEPNAPARWEPLGVRFYLIVTRTIMKRIHYLDCMSPVKIGIYYVGNDTCIGYFFF